MQSAASSVICCEFTDNICLRISEGIMFLFRLGLVISTHCNRKAWGLKRETWNKMNNQIKIKVFPALPLLSKQIMALKKCHGAKSFLNHQDYSVCESGSKILFRSLPETSKPNQLCRMLWTSNSERKLPLFLSSTKTTITKIGNEIWFSVVFLV